MKEKNLKEKQAKNLQTKTLKKPITLENELHSVHKKNYRNEEV